MTLDVKPTPTGYRLHVSQFRDAIVESEDEFPGMLLQNMKRLLSGELASSSNGDTLGLPPTQDSSHHQDYYVFSRKSL